MSTGDAFVAGGPNPPKQAPLKSMKRPAAVTSRTTYRFQPYDFAQSIPVVSILALNRQTKKEAVSHFPGTVPFDSIKLDVWFQS